MRFIKNLVHQLMPEQYSDKELSVLCISTTNPVYLVFTNQAAYPELVIREANTEDARQAHDIAKALFDKVGNLIPEPIAIHRYNDRNFSVQRGAKGTPWFQLTQHITTPTHWNELRDRATTALNQLHNGTMAIENWRSECKPGEALRDRLKQCIASGTKLPQLLNQQVATMSQQLDSLGTLSTFPQHGDYCLNNLIIDTDDIHIIDFEDFGMTSMPLHDEFSLALSMYSKSSKNIDTSLQYELNTCTKKGAETLGIPVEMLPGFFMHHLLLRLGEWSLPTRRKQYREWLITILNDFIHEPQLLFPPSSNQK